MELVIMAAGMGSRFGGLKQIAPMGPNDEFIILLIIVKYLSNTSLFITFIKILCFSPNI